MKIVFVVTKIGRGGAQRVSVVLAGYLKRRGHQVSILYYDGNGTYPLEEGIQTFQLPYSKNVFLKHGKRILSFNRYCREHQVDLVVALFRGYDYTWLYRKTSHSRLILSQRNDPKAEYDHDPVARWESRTYFGGADAVVFQTDEEMEYFDEKIKRKSRVIANPVMDGLPEPYEGPRKKLIVNFCRLEPQKNLRLLLDAFRDVCDVTEGYHLKIFGEGRERDSLIDYIGQLGLSEQAEILPFSGTIHEEIRDAGMFVCSSDFEGISNSMLEAMALGIPCICTDCPAGGARQVITDGVNGLLTPVGDEKALAEAMLRLIREPEYAGSLGEAAKLVRETYSSEAICRQWEELIDEVMGKEGRQ